MAEADRVGKGRTPRVSFYVQHLLGIGHLARAFRIGAAMAEDGWAVDLLVGGPLPPGLTAGRATITALPPVMAGPGGFSALVHPDGMPFGADDQARRRDKLLAHVAATGPDVLLIEAFPFGRRLMRFELLPLLESVKARRDPPLVACSLRDILQENRRPERVAETLATVERFFDLVLVHGDPRLVRLEESFRQAGAIAGKVAYTGLVAPKPPGSAHPPERIHDVVVSVGGGAVGHRLLATALEAKALSFFADARWLLLTGPNLPEASRAELARKAGAGTVLLPFVPDLAAVLQGATVSVSQAGYNTVADILVAGCAAVLVPFAADGETEQAVRAARLAERGRAVVLREIDLAPQALARAIDEAAGQPSIEQPFGLDGAARTALLLREALAARRHV